jgi:hypothetical protein
MKRIRKKEEKTTVTNRKNLIEPVQHRIVSILREKKTATKG